MYIKLVGINGALNHGFTQAITRGNKNHIRKTRLGINREHHARCTQIRAHHALNSRTQGHMLVGKAFVNAVTDGAVVVKRGKDFSNFVQDVFNSDHVQKRFLLTCKRRVWQIFGRG